VYEQRPSQPDPAVDPRDQEQLREQTDERDPVLEVAVERRDQGPHVDARRLCRAGRGIALHEVREHELAGRVDPVQQYDQQRDQQQVAVAEHEPKPA